MADAQIGTQQSLSVVAGEFIGGSMVVSRNPTDGLFYNIYTIAGGQVDAITPAGVSLNVGDPGHLPRSGIVQINAPYAPMIPGDLIYVDTTTGALSNLTPVNPWLFVGTAQTDCQLVAAVGDIFSLLMRPVGSAVPGGNQMLFVSRGDSNSVSNTVTETLFNGGVNKTFTLPANSLGFGQVLVIRAGGVYSTAAGADRTLQIRLRVDGLAGLNYYDTGPNMRWGNGLTGRSWSIQLCLVTVGSPSPNISCENSTVSLGKDDASTGTGTGSVVTSGFSALANVSHTFTFTAQWGLAVAGSSVKQTFMSAELLAPALIVL